MTPSETSVLVADGPRGQTDRLTTGLEPGPRALRLETIHDRRVSLSNQIPFPFIPPAPSVGDEQKHPSPLAGPSAGIVLQQTLSGHGRRGRQA